MRLLMRICAYTDKKGRCVRRQQNGILLHIGFPSREAALIFPEIEYDKIDKVRGMDISFVTTAATDEEGRELLSLMGAPFQRN